HDVVLEWFWKLIQRRQRAVEVRLADANAPGAPGNAIRTRGVGLERIVEDQRNNVTLPVWIDDREPSGQREEQRVGILFERKPVQYQHRGIDLRDHERPRGGELSLRKANRRADVRIERTAGPLVQQAVERGEFAVMIRGVSALGRMLPFASLKMKRTWGLKPPSSTSYGTKCTIWLSKNASRTVGSLATGPPGTGSRVVPSGTMGQFRKMFVWTSAIE